MEKVYYLFKILICIKSSYCYWLCHL